MAFTVPVVFGLISELNTFLNSPDGLALVEADIAKVESVYEAIKAAASTSIQDIEDVVLKLKKKA